MLQREGSYCPLLEEIQSCYASYTVYFLVRCPYSIFAHPLLQRLKGNGFIAKGDDSVEICFAFHVNFGPIWKEGFRSQCSKFFCFRVVPFQKKLFVLESKQELTKVVSLIKMAAEISMLIVSVTVVPGLTKIYTISLACM